MKGTVLRMSQSVIEFDTMTRNTFKKIAGLINEKGDKLAELARLEPGRQSRKYELHAEIDALEKAITKESGDYRTATKSALYDMYVIYRDCDDLPEYRPDDYILTPLERAECIALIYRYAIKKASSNAMYLLSGKAADFFTRVLDATKNEYNILLAESENITASLPF